MAKSFKQWIQENNLPLEITTAKAEKTVDEKQARAGIAHWAYPPAYMRHQYPAPYFMPRAADAVQKMGKDGLKA